MFILHMLFRSLILPSISITLTTPGISAGSPAPPALHAITRNLYSAPWGMWVKVYSQIFVGVVLHFVHSTWSTFCISIRYPVTAAPPSSSGVDQASDIDVLVVSVTLGFSGIPGGSV